MSLMLVIKIWIGGFLFLVLMHIVRALYYLCYDWRWHFKGEKPARSCQAQLDDMLSWNHLAKNTPLTTECIKIVDGDFGFIYQVKNKAGEIVAAAWCRNIRGVFDRIKYEFPRLLMFEFIWPAWVVALVIDWMNELMLTLKQKKNK